MSRRRAASLLGWAPARAAVEPGSSTTMDESGWVCAYMSSAMAPRPHGGPVGGRKGPFRLARCQCCGHDLAALPTVEDLRRASQFCPELGRFTCGASDGG